jgi:hypothetical protein
MDLSKEARWVQIHSYIGADSIPIAGSLVFPEG